MVGKLAARALLHLCCSWDASARFIGRVSNNTGISVTLDAFAPQNAKDLMSAHLSFSIEQDRWPDWVGCDVRNEFTYTALVNLQQFTGEPPRLRVGANSEDHTTWDPSVTVVEVEFPPPSTVTPYPEATRVTVGDGFYQLCKNAPAGTHMTWGLNFGLDNATNAVNMAESIMRAFASSAVKSANVHLDLLELGNEADLYTRNGMRPKGWTAQNYTQDWIHIATAVVDALKLRKGSSVSLEGAAFGGQGFTPKEIFNAGILDSKPGRLISTISQHRYSGAFCSGTAFALSSFMSKKAVRGNITVFEADIQETLSKNLTYILGETGSLACHGAPGVSNTAGAALWVIDYTLQAACNSITTTYFHEGVGFKYNFIQPIALNRSILDGSPLDPPQPAQIMPSYYAAILVARTIGNTGTARIAEVTVNDTNVSGYAVYESNKLVRAVFVNLNPWLLSSTGMRPSVHLDLDFTNAGAASVRKASIRRLVIQHADDTHGLMLGGQSYETSDATVCGKEQLENIKISDGVDLRATEAVLISFP